MAKRSKWFKEVILDKGYRSGIWQSVIFHECLFIILLLIILDVPVEQKRIDPIILSFNTSEPVVTVDAPLNLSESTAENIDTDNSSADVSELLDNDTPKVVVDEQPQIQPDTIPDLERVEISEIQPEQLMAEVVPEKDLFKKSTTKISKKKLNTKNNKRVVKNTNTSAQPTNALMKLMKSGTSLGDGIPASALIPTSSGKGTGMSEQGAKNIEARLQSYGAKGGDIQISLIWNTRDDIDLWVNDGFQSIGWRSRRSRSGGMLDIDMNASNRYFSNTPVENIFWPLGTAPRSRYTVAIHFFRSWTGNTVVPVIVRVRTRAGDQYYNVNAVFGSGDQIVTVFTN